MTLQNKAYWLVSTADWISSDQKLLTNWTKSKTSSSVFRHKYEHRSWWCPLKVWKSDSKHFWHYFYQTGNRSHSHISGLISSPNLRPAKKTLWRFCVCVFPANVSTKAFALIWEIIGTGGNLGWNGVNVCTSEAFISQPKTKRHYYYDSDQQLL